MTRAKLTSKGQITLPKEIREHLDVKPGDRLDFQIRDGGEVVVAPHTVDFFSLRGMLKYSGPPVSVEEMNEAIRQFHAAEDDRIRHQYSRSVSRRARRQPTGRNR